MIFDLFISFVLFRVVEYLFVFSFVFSLVNIYFFVIGGRRQDLRVSTVSQPPAPLFALFESIAASPSSFVPADTYGVRTAKPLRMLCGVCDIPVSTCTCFSFLL